MKVIIEMPILMTYLLTVKKVVLLFDDYII